MHKYYECSKVNEKNQRTNRIKIMDTFHHSSYFEEQIISCEYVVPLPAMGKAKALLLQNSRKKADKTDPIQEAARLDKAIFNAGMRLKRIYECMQDRTEATVIKAYIMMTEDGELRLDILRQIDLGFLAEEAISNVVGHYTSQLERADITEFRERAVDFAEVCNGIINQLNGGVEEDYSAYKDTIVIAHEISAVQMLLLSEAEVAGVAVERGGYTGHEAVFARTEGIPYAIHVPFLLEKTQEGDELLFEPQNKVLVLNPAETRKHLFSIGLDFCEPLPFIAANVSGKSSLRFAKQMHVSRIGLVRTEAFLMKWGRKPDQHEQELIYQEILGIGVPVYIRLADVDEDKQILWMKTEKKGKVLRGRDSFNENADFYVTQIRALLSAGCLRPNGIMLPMVRTSEDFLEIKKIIRVMAEDMGICDSLMIGCMIESGEAVESSAEIAKIADFISIGTNDLSRYLFGKSRSDDLSIFIPGLANIIWKIAKDCHVNGITAGVCGDVAANPANIMKLLECGIDYVSVPPYLISVVAHELQQNTGI
jgi:phosphoenolpyruvate-protein kinase (PTS system EI component)